MKPVNWASVFETVRKRRGASDQVLARFVTNVGQPLSANELDWLKDIQPQPERWRIPNRLLPPDYLNLLRWSNGGLFQNGDRLWQFFPANGAIHGIRVMMLAYGVPHYAPGILPIAFNGSGIFY